MIAANGVTARFLAARGPLSLRRVLRSPERWERIVQLTADLNERLPGAPDAAALEAFLSKRRQADPDRFPDLSLAVVKLMGRGEYERGDNVICNLHRRVHHPDCRLGDRSPPAPGASEVDRGGHSLSDRRGHHPWRDGDSAKRSAVLAQERRVRTGKTPHPPGARGA